LFYLTLGDRISFLDEIENVRKESKRLKELGVGILIALGHSGYELDKKLAAEVEEIDVVVGMGFTGVIHLKF